MTLCTMRVCLRRQGFLDSRPALVRCRKRHSRTLQTAPTIARDRCVGYGQLFPKAAFAPGAIRCIEMRLKP